MRLFAGLELGEEVREGLLDWWHEVHAHDRDGLWRAVQPHLWHLTLAFYGEVEAHDAEDLAEELSACAEATAPLHLTIRGFGVFPKPSRPRVFWAGVQDEGGGLKHLARCCRRAGHATVRRKSGGQTGHAEGRRAGFAGHVTLARCHKADALLARSLLRAELPEPPELSWLCEEMVLFQSILRPEGPQYRRLERFRLAGNDKTGDEDVG